MISHSDLLCPVVFGFSVKELVGSASGLRQSSQHVSIGCWAEKTKHAALIYLSFYGLIIIVNVSECVGSFRPEAAGEQAAVLSVVSEQLQSELCVLDVTV